MDSVTEFETAELAGPDVSAEQNAAQEAANRKRERERIRLRRKLANVKRRARSQGFIEGVLSQLGTGDIVVECGANRGGLTKRLAQTGATVYAFEPDPLAFAELEQSCGDFPNLCTINAAVGARQDTAMLYRSPLFGTEPLKATLSSSLIPSGEESETEFTAIEVPVFDLPTVLIDVLAGRDPAGLPERLGVFRRPDALAVLLLDIEGSEHEVLSALHQADLLTQIQTTVARTHEGISRKFRRNLTQLRREFEGSYSSSQVFLDWA